MNSDSIWQTTTTEAPCPLCKGTGSIREDVGGGERRSTFCPKCEGKGTMLAVKLREEYVRGWNAAFAEIEKTLTGLKRSHRL